MFVCCECCVLSGRGLCDELITRPEESYWLVRHRVCSRKPQEWGGHDPHWVAAPQKKKISHCLHLHSQCLHLPHTSNIPILFTAVPQHIIYLIHRIGYAALINPLNAKLNSICHFLALLVAHPILHVSRIRVKTLHSHFWWDKLPFHYDPH